MPMSLTAKSKFSHIRRMLKSIRNNFTDWNDLYIWIPLVWLTIGTNCLAADICFSAFMAENSVHDKLSMWEIGVVSFCLKPELEMSSTQKIHKIQWHSFICIAQTEKSYLSVITIKSRECISHCGPFANGFGRGTKSAAIGYKLFLLGIE